MYSVMRHYQGQPQLAAELKKHAKDIEKLISAVPGFTAYYLVHNAEGCTTITLCETRKGCDESTKLAADWLQKNVTNLKVTAPLVSYGDVSVAFDRIHAHV
jgi:hypothetical protein